MISKYFRKRARKTRYFSQRLKSEYHSCFTQLFTCYSSRNLTNINLIKEAVLKEVNMN